MKRPLVVKLGSSLVVDGDGKPRRAFLRARAREIADVVENGTPVCVVSSGAIALGLRRLQLTRRPTSLPRLQAASALGKAELQRAWQDAFQSHGIDTAQILLTHADLADRERYLNARSTLLTLLRLGAVPIINENDTVITDEIKFGDNDTLGALVANLIEADVLVLLTDQRGLYTADPRILGTTYGFFDFSDNGQRTIGQVRAQPPLTRVQPVRPAELARLERRHGGRQRLVGEEARRSHLVVRLQRHDVVARGQRLGGVRGLVVLDVRP